MQWMATISSLIVLLALLFLGAISVYSLQSIVDDDYERAMPRWLIRLLFLFALISVLLFLVVALSVPLAEQMRVLAAVVAGAAGAFVIGGLAGFIFGIPRAIQIVGSNAAGVSVPNYSPNTNLERVSEWLTGIIVGLTLVQFDQIRDYFNDASRSLMRVLGQGEPFFAGALIIFFVISGFLISYIWTRLRLLGDLTRADDVARRTPEYLEGLMHAFLYTPPPEGYKQALKYGDEYQRQFKVFNPRILIYLACAYGQQYRFLSAKATKGAKLPPDETPEESRSNALSSIKDCLQFDPSSYKMLHALWDPHEASPGEDDLTVFFEDAEFIAAFQIAATK